MASPVSRDLCYRQSTEGRLRLDAIAVTYLLNFEGLAAPEHGCSNLLQSPPPYVTISHI